MRGKDLQITSSWGPKAEEGSGSHTYSRTSAAGVGLNSVILQWCRSLVLHVSQMVDAMWISRFKFSKEKSHWQPVSVIHVQTEHFIPATHELLASPGIICPLVRCLPVGQSGVAWEGEMVRWLNYFSCPLPLPEESMVGQLLMERAAGKEVSAMIHMWLYAGTLQRYCRLGSRPPQ